MTTREKLLQRAGILADPEPPQNAAPKLTAKAKHLAVLTPERKARISAAARNPKSGRKRFPVITID